MNTRTNRPSNAINSINRNSQEQHRQKQQQREQQQAIMVGGKPYHRGETYESVKTETSNSKWRQTETTASSTTATRTTATTMRARTGNNGGEKVAYHRREKKSKMWILCEQTRIHYGCHFISTSSHVRFYFYLNKCWADLCSLSRT